jgi:protoporphyrinogen/coproporphyrinogen III oxidase
MTGGNIGTDITVVGGGIAGMVVARRLAMAGRAVTLIEASDHLGGTVARHTVGGIDLDAGAESFATRGGTVAALAAELGLGGDIVTPTAG